MVEPFLASCQHTITQHEGLLMTLFLGGVAGNFTNCAGMCGPCVMAETTARLNDISTENMSEWQRLRGMALLPYHLGRITTYAGLGVMVSLLTQAVVMASGFRLLNAILLFTAGLLFVAMASGIENLMGLNFRMPITGQIQSFFSSKAGAFLSSPTGINGYMAGLLLGFLPCGLLYSALLIVSAVNPPMAAVGMLLFGLGTVPALFMVSYWTSYAGKKMKPLVNRVGHIFMCMNGIVLIALAVQKLM